jgi:RNA polymerase sigma-70 factor (family 1)
LRDSDTLKRLTYLIGEGDPDAFRKFYDIYFRKVHQFTGYFIKSDAIGEEIVSDVFLTVWITREKLAEIENIEAYLYTITRNKAFNYLNKEAREPDFTAELPIEFSERSNNPEEMVLTEELRQVIQSSINELPEKCKMVFLMSRDEGMRYQDIARILSISEKTVNAQIVTALRKLHLALQKYLFILI